MVLGAVYLVLSVALWWHVWAGPASLSTCGCGDNALTLWVIEWPAWALAHGHNPFYSAALFHPHGINMVPNSLALGTLGAPVTWLFGPVAMSNVITVLSPALTATAMCWLVLRWTSSTVAAFTAGLLYGFSPFVLTSLALGHPNFGLLALVPLVVICVERLVTGAGRPLPTGVLLGVLLVGQFFVSVEVLLLVVLFGVLGLVAVALWAAVARPGDLRERLGPVLGGLVSAAVVSAVLLAYPLWFYFAGPAHLSGRAWPNSPPGIVGSSFADFAWGTVSPGLTATMHVFGGYQGPALPALTLLGVGLLIVVAAGWVVWHRDARLWLFGGLGIVAALLSLGVRPDTWTPWRLFTSVPVLDNVVPVNIASITDLCASVMVGLVVAHVAARLRPAAQRSAATVGPVLVALVPLLVLSWPNLPMTVRPVSAPAWFRSASARQDAGGHRQVVLPYPAAFGGIQSSMAWQAVNHLPFDMVGGGGPGIVPSRAGPERPGFEVLEQASVPLGPAPGPSRANLEHIREALAGWGVTTVVVPDQPELPTYDRGRSVAYAVGLLTAAVGSPPTLEHRAWVWRRPTASGRPVVMDDVTFAGCVNQGSGGRADLVAGCVLRSASVSASR